MTDAMRAGVGAVLAVRTSHPVDASAIRRWAIAVYWPQDPPARFLGGRDKLVAPEEFNPFAWSVAEHRTEHPAPDPADPDRIEKLLGVEGPGLRTQLNGGVVVTHTAPMCEGDVITGTDRLVDYSVREGKRGPMLMTTTEDTWVNQTGSVVRRTSMTLIRY
ncbi:MaoC family dehydratase N-terminal domain-containing protein [Rhodococcus sp. SORGH_AS_0301]|uniref:FAS1-like dehydratase domain-containing protein n=1 Tax=Rhodococcus sp. SORGH_AS_0301 TaxID=3041780 RepID=UPI0027D7D6BB|nr:MaoC family dehydratase N-terminal domain-containing protein [Rhodococcus sp. SORGH_AS_0301]